MSRIDLIGRKIKQYFLIKSNKQFIIFLFGIPVFIFASVLGWDNLHYGFNYIDEGWHMTESWRLAVGDHFLKDKLIGANSLYTIFNSFFFKIWPNITLLDFRKIQFFTLLISIIFFGISLYKFSKEYWFLPYILSLFAFLGLNYSGQIQNLNYFTYPHLFVILYLTGLLFALSSSNALIRYICLFFSGLSLWAISFTLLHLSPVVLSPIILFLLNRNKNIISFNFKELVLTLIPFLSLWSIFIIVYNKSYLTNLLYTVNVQFIWHGSTSSINWHAIQHICVVLIIALFIFHLYHQYEFSALSFLALLIMSIFLYFIIATSFWGLIRPYLFGLYSETMWFSALLIAFLIIFWLAMVLKYFLRYEYSTNDIFCIILLTPCTIAFLFTSFFSNAGALSAGFYSIPIITALTTFLMHRKHLTSHNYIVKLIILIIFLIPFYLNQARAGWNLNFFDVSRSDASSTIDNGFGKGIKTNDYYYEIYEWIIKTSKKYSTNKDFMISYPISPMVHMIAKRRPAMGDTWISFDQPLSYLSKSIEKMIRDNREPKISYVFDKAPMLTLISIEGKKLYNWSNSTILFDFATSNDPISIYVKKNMKEVDELIISDDFKVTCLVRK